MKVFGKLNDVLAAELLQFIEAVRGLHVTRANQARSSTPLPVSTDLEAALVPLLEARGFQHHVRLKHPRTGDGFEYDFWRRHDGVALEVMGYRADDEVYKDLLKFHVHDDTKVGIVLVPRWKWIKGRRQDRNYTETMKALGFADTYMAVGALVAITYDWRRVASEGTWSLAFIEDED